MNSGSARLTVAAILKTGCTSTGMVRSNPTPAPVKP
jgi:hypothetical protein